MKIWIEERRNVESDRVSAEATENDSEMVTYCNSDLGDGRDPEMSAFPTRGKNNLRLAPLACVLPS